MSSLHTSLPESAYTGYTPECADGGTFRNRYFQSLYMVMNITRRTFQQQKNTQKMLFDYLQDGPLGWEVKAQCSEASLVLWYPEEEEQDPDQARTRFADCKAVSDGVYSSMCFPAHFICQACLLPLSARPQSNFILVLSQADSLKTAFHF